MGGGVGSLQELAARAYLHQPRRNRPSGMALYDEGLIPLLAFERLQENWHRPWRVNHRRSGFWVPHGVKDDDALVWRPSRKLLQFGLPAVPRHRRKPLVIPSDEEWRKKYFYPGPV